MMFDESEEMQEVFDAKRECVWVTKADMSICCGLYNVKSDGCEILSENDDKKILHSTREEYIKQIE